MTAQNEIAPAAPPTPFDMLNRAVNSGASIEVLTKLMDLQERYDHAQARMAFDEAIAAAKGEIPVIEKNRTGHNNKKYADFAALARVVDPILGKHGLSYRFRTVQDERIHVTCILSHKAGHFEENTLNGPADATGSKNAIQAIGSTLTYLQRYTLTQALGLAASEDDDGKSAGTAPITTEQAEEIKKLTENFSSERMQKFFTYIGIESLEQMPAAKFERAKE